MIYCDLHTHSTFSDGTLTPTGIIELADKLGLAAVALTDHNNVDGLPEFIAAGKGKQVKTVAGAEFSVDYEGTELHLLGLYLPEGCFDRVSGLMEDVNRRKEESNLALVAALDKAGYRLDYKKIKASTPKGKLNRSDIAQALMEAGYVSSIDEAFTKLLDPERGYYVEPQRLTVWQILDLIREVGGVSVLAHPFLNLNESQLEEFLPRAKAYGLVGMECHYSEFTPQQTQSALALADRFGLLPSGGSDFHGDRKPHIQLGTGTGSLAVPAAWAEALKP